MAERAATRGFVMVAVQSASTVRDATRADFHFWYTHRWLILALLGAIALPRCRQPA